MAIKRVGAGNSGLPLSSSALREEENSTRQKRRRRRLALTLLLVGIYALNVRWALLTTKSLSLTDDDNTANNKNKQQWKLPSSPSEEKPSLQASGDIPLLRASDDANVSRKLPSSPPEETPSLQASDDIPLLRASDDTNVSRSYDPLSGAAEDGSFMSSCLLVMDENHRLPEWLAYHYYMLPLRHLVLLVDPQSQTSPWKVLRRWLPYMKIEVWSDDDLGEDYKNDPRRQSHAAQYIARQHVFYRQCAQHFYERYHNVTQQQDAFWVTFHDVDEYVYLDPEAVPDARHRMQQPHAVVDFLHELRYNPHRNVSNFTTIVRPEGRVKIIRHDQEPLNSNATCFVLSRTLFGTHQPPNDTTTVAAPPRLPFPWNVEGLETYRYVYRSQHGDRYQLNGLGKCILDVGPRQTQGSADRPFHWRSSIHRLLNECAFGYGHQLRIRHYLGSWDAFTSRLDPRKSDKRNLQYFEFASRLGQTADTAVSDWLTGFAQQWRYNQSQLQHLLAGAGHIERPPNATTPRPSKEWWSLTPEQIQKQSTSKLPFGKWIRTIYNVSTLPNGTLVATQIRPFG